MAKIKQIDGLQAALDAKAAKATVTGATKTKITYNNDGIVEAGADLVEGDIPALQISKVTGLQTALNNKVEKNANITPGTHPKITYDAKGLVTGGAGLAAGDIPNLDAGKITSGEFATARLPVVPVSKGGTGRAALMSNAYIKGAGTSQVTLIAKTSVKADIGLGNVDNVQQVQKASSSTDGYIPKWDGTDGNKIVDGWAVRTDVRGTGAADTDLPTEKAVRDAINAALQSADAMTYKGAIDASPNPNYPLANAGDTYKISVAGKLGGASGTNVFVGDIAICTTDDTPAGTHADVGDEWNVIHVNREGEVIGPSVAVNHNIAVFDGTSGKLIKDGGTTIAAIQAGATRQHQNLITGYTSAANATLTITTGLSHVPASGTIPQCSINGLEIPLGSYASLAVGRWAFSARDVRVHLPYALEADDEIVITFNY
jgi:hypothetical protein